MTNRSQILSAPKVPYPKSVCWTNVRTGRLGGRSGRFIVRTGILTLLKTDEWDVCADEWDVLADERDVQDGRMGCAGRLFFPLIGHRLPQIGDLQILSLEFEAFGNGNIVFLYE
jgi:hypothetical protein